MNFNFVNSNSSFFKGVYFVCTPAVISGIPRNFFRGEVQQIQLRTEGRENGDLGAVAP